MDGETHLAIALDDLTELAAQYTGVGGVGNSAASKAKRALRGLNVEHFKLPDGLLKATAIPAALFLMNVPVLTPDWNQFARRTKEHLLLARRSAGAATASSSSVLVRSESAPPSMGRQRSGRAGAGPLASSVALDACLVPRLPTQTTRQTFELMSHNTLVDLALRNENVISKLMQHSRGLQRKLDRTSNQLVLAQGGGSSGVDSLAAFQIEREENKRLFSAKAILAVGMRCAMTGVAAKSLGPAVLQDISRQKVTKCEIELGAAWVAAARVFHDEMEVAASQEQLQQTDAGQGASLSSLAHCVACHSISSDATNSAVWHNSKLHSTVVQSLYIRDAAELASGTAGPNFWRTFADLQRVRDSSAARPCA